MSEHFSLATEVCHQVNEKKKTILNSLQWIKINEMLRKQPVSKQIKKQRKSSSNSNKEREIKKPMTGKTDTKIAALWIEASIHN